MSAIFRVTESGTEKCFRTEHDLELLDAARLLRDYLQRWRSLNTKAFSEIFPAWEQISTEEFHQLCMLRMENTGEVSGAFDLDLDKHEFAAVHIMDGWKVFSMDDICAAADHAFREERMSRDDRWSLLLDELDGKELTSAGHFSARDISLAAEICEMDGQRLNFYLEADFDVDAVFGTHVCTGENDDTLNVYADYDMASGQVCDELEVDLHLADGREESIEYRLNAVEKATLLRKMDDYCQQQTGQSLKDYSAQLMAEDMEPPTGPTM